MNNNLDPNVNIPEIKLDNPGPVATSQLIEQSTNQRGFIKFKFPKPHFKSPKQKKMIFGIGGGILILFVILLIRHNFILFLYFK